MDVETSTPFCASCQERTRRFCTACVDAPSWGDQTGKTYYCSKKCQKNDRTTHKPHCKRLQSRKILLRAGYTLQEIFYVYREKVFDRPISKVEVRDGKIYIHDGKYVKQKVVTTYDWAQPFPSGLFSNDEDKRAALVHLGCQDSVAFMHDIIKHVLNTKNIASKVVEITFNPKNSKRETIAINSSGEEGCHTRDCLHTCLRVTLNSGELYALDMTGAQFGYFEPVTPWKEFYENRVRSFSVVNGVEDFGWWKNHLEERFGASVAGKNGLLSLHVEGSKSLIVDTLDWEKETDQTVQQMLTLPESQFKIKQQELIDYIGIGLRLSMEAMARKSEEVKAQVAAGTVQLPTKGKDRNA